MNRKRLRIIIVTGIITTLLVILLSVGLVLQTCCTPFSATLTQRAYASEVVMTNDYSQPPQFIKTQTAAYSIELTLTQAITSTSIATP